jgi:serine/threonine-protein kinase
MRDQAFTPRDVETVLHVIAPAIGATHQLGIIHRDLKPSNILYDKSEGKFYLSDFSFSKRPGIDETLTSTGMTVGTPYYVSPESIRGNTITPRTDIYSLGIMTYEMLVGQVPFVFNSISEIAQAHVMLPPKRLVLHHPKFPRYIEGVVLRALAKEPSQRYASIKEFADAYSHALTLHTDSEINQAYWA